MGVIALVLRFPISSRGRKEWHTDLSKKLYHPQVPILSNCRELRNLSIHFFKVSTVYLVMLADVRLRLVLLYNFRHDAVVACRPERFRRISTSQTNELMCHRRRLLSGSPSLPSESSDDATQSPQVHLQGPQPQQLIDEKVDVSGSKWPRLRGATKSGPPRQRAISAANSTTASSVSTPSAGDLTSPLASASFDLASFTNISPVVAIKNHLDALAKQESAAAAERTSGCGNVGALGTPGGGAIEEHSRFRLRPRNKKKLGVIDRPLSQIIGLDSVALMRDLAAIMGSSVQPRSEERLCADPPLDSDPARCDKALADHPSQPPARTDVQQTAAENSRCSEADLQRLEEAAKDDIVVGAAAAVVSTPSFAPRLADVCPVPHLPSVASDRIVLPLDDEEEQEEDKGQFCWSTSKAADGQAEGCLNMHHSTSSNFQSTEGNVAGHSTTDRWQPSQNSAFRNIGSNIHLHQQPRPQPLHYPLHAFLDCDGDTATTAVNYTPDYAPESRVRSISDTRSSLSHGFLSAFNDPAAPRKYSADLPSSPPSQVANGWPTPRQARDDVPSPVPLSRNRQSAFVYSRND
ncbi:unnamed protein product, partial [Schistocephalus solidus]|uniref:Protein kinase domain-containing protein n=1 Tax=Schistocephalus solidus TaxID=70667 RepID=A0A183T5M2_SCHSO